MDFSLYFHYHFTPFVVVRWVFVTIAYLSVYITLFKIVMPFLSLPASKNSGQCFKNANMTYICYMFVSMQNDYASMIAY